MACIIQLIQWADGRPLHCSGQYVQFVNVQLADLSPEWLVPTPFINKARRWDTAADALKTWREILVSDPVRPDGEPNRPFTALTIELIHLDRIEGGDEAA